MSFGFDDDGDYTGRTSKCRTSRFIGHVRFIEGHAVFVPRDYNWRHIFRGEGGGSRD